MGIFGFGSNKEEVQEVDDIYSPSGQSFEETTTTYGLDDAGYDKLPDFMTSITVNASQLQPMSLQGLDFLQVDDAPTGSSPSFAPSRSFGDDLCYGAGSTYLAGLTLGGAYGMMEGLKNSSGAPKVRLNTTLNYITRRGPGLGNAAGVIALLYSGTNSLIDRARGQHDIFNSLTAGAIAGAIFKSTAGPRVAAISAGLCAGAAGVWTILVDIFAD
ncbi:Tim17/Tim22/Tim23/Pmp24 family-domain-containing protein [Pilobolus umbonatus]|nr:Tim17/Tim22/Tim23/Pmp24 family-domain-containing protein [Pilobolus umbonatus]